MLISWLVVSCAVGTEEPNTSGVLVDSSREIEVPEGLTARDIDLNKDGTVDILDLVIASKFMGQDVTEADAVAETSGDLDESDPCREIRKADPYIIPRVETVEDNTEFKQTFDAPNGNTYAYALLAMTKWRNTASKAPPDSVREEYDTPSCVAIRFTIDNKIIPREFKVKPVAGHKNMFSETIISPRFDYSESRVGERYSDGWSLSGRTWDMWLEGPLGRLSNWHIRAKSLDIPQSSYQRSLGGNPSSSLARLIKRTLKKGIPIDERSVIYKLWFAVEEGDSYETFYNWYIWYDPNDRPLRNRYETGQKDNGVYVKMLPSEVRKRYFPEDIE